MVLVVELETFLRNYCVILPICIPWMDDYDWIFGASLVLTLVKKYILISNDSFCELWVKSILVSSICIIVFPASVLLSNKYLYTRTQKRIYGTVIELKKAPSGPPTKIADSWNNWIKIKLDDENASFWYDLGKKSEPLGTKCILLEKKGH